MNLISLYSAPFRMGGLSEVINHYKLNLKKKHKMVLCTFIATLVVWSRMILTVSYLKEKNSKKQLN